MLIERYVEAFNAGDVDGALAVASADYDYADPTSGHLDRAANGQLMRQVLSAFPDRRITLGRVVSGDGFEFAEGSWRGTPAAGGDPLGVTGVVVVEVDDGTMTAQRWHYDPPPGGFLSVDETGDMRTSMVERFLDLLVAREFALWAQLWAPEAIVLAPFAPDGFPGRLDGRETIVATFGQLFRRYGWTRFRERCIMPTVAAGSVVGRWRAEMDVAGADGRYESDVIAVFETDGRQLTRYTEYFNPDRVRAARTT